MLPKAVCRTDFSKDRPMKFNYDILDDTEKIGYALLSLYGEYGYCKYRMSKFEEYDFYSRNKDFLLSDNIITFTDINSKLMALKPDVTLSIIKNSRDEPDCLKKLSYKENVYRVPRGGSSFREIMQVGLECMGDVDIQCLSEVLVLAAKSLELTGTGYALEISDLDILSFFVNSISEKPEVRRALFKCAGEKNLHEIREICTSFDIAREKIEPLEILLSLSGSPADEFRELERLAARYGIGEELAVLKDVVSDASEKCGNDRIKVDFSIVSDMNYYNGIVFRGFLDGIPTSVLSGGQYDKLMRKMDRKSKAIGFAVYIDMMQHIFDSEEVRT